MEQVCGVHGTPLVLKPAGVSKTTGKEYKAFWSCPQRNNDGSYCTFKPQKQAVVPLNMPSGHLDAINAKLERMEQKIDALIRFSASMRHEVKPVQKEAPAIIEVIPPHESGYDVASIPF